MLGLAGKIRGRARTLADGRAFPLSDRLRRAVSPGGGATDRDRLLSRLRTADDGAEYFDMNGTRVYFRPAHAPAGSEAVLSGAVQILKEAYLGDPGFFSGEVKISPGDTVLDLGGNLGTSAMLFSPLAGPKGRVMSFEPIYADLLRRNAAENGCDNVTVVASAVGDRVGEADFAVTEEGIDSRIDPGGTGGLRRAVPLTTIDDWCAREGVGRVDFIKMDIEGAEEPALRGGEATIRRDRPKLSVASYHRDAGFGGDRQHPKLVALLRSWGYELREVGEKHIFGW